VGDSRRLPLAFAQYGGDAVAVVAAGLPDDGDRRTAGPAVEARSAASRLCQPPLVILGQRSGPFMRRWRRRGAVVAAGHEQPQRLGAVGVDRHDRVEGMAASVPGQSGGPVHVDQRPVGRVRSWRRDLGAALSAAQPATDERVRLTAGLDAVGAHGRFLAVV